MAEFPHVLLVPATDCYSSDYVRLGIRPPHEYAITHYQTPPNLNDSTLPWHPEVSRLIAVHDIRGGNCNLVGTLDGLPDSRESAIVTTNDHFIAGDRCPFCITQSEESIIASAHTKCEVPPMFLRDPQWTVFKSCWGPCKGHASCQCMKRWPN